MIISNIITLLNAQVLSKNADVNRPIETACGSDMMSDVLAYIKKDSILLTGLINPQVIRTAEMLDIVCLIFVRGKRPAPEIIEKANQLDICVLGTDYAMFEACGILYNAGLRGGEACHD